MTNRWVLLAAVLSVGLASASPEEEANLLVSKATELAGKLGADLPAKASAPAGPAAPSAAWHEQVEDGEQAQFEGFAREIEAQQQAAAQGQHGATTIGPLRRGFHAKLHAGLVAEFRVLDNLPQSARVGLFASARTFPAVVRFSNGSPTLEGDGRPDPRGIGVKVIGVPGKKLLAGFEDAVTQDFLATSHSVTSTVRNVREFFVFIHAIKNKLTLPITLARELGVVESARLIKAFATTVLLAKVNSMATEQFSSTAPIQFGALAGKFTIRATAGTPAAVPRKKTENFLADELADRLRAGDLVFDFLVQFYVDDKNTPIEDTSVAWSPVVTPFVKVAEIRIPRQDLADAAVQAKSLAVDKLSFNPWHALVEHKPLGNIMRARKVAYQASAKLRGAAGEPTKLEDVK